MAAQGAFVSCSDARIAFVCHRASMTFWRVYGLCIVCRVLFRVRACVEIESDVALTRVSTCVMIDSCERRTHETRE